MQNASFKVGVIGCGFGRHHIQTLAEGVPHLTLAAVCDVDDNRLADQRKNPALRDKPIRFTSDYKDILNDPEIGIVSLALPHHLHEKFAVEAAAAGKHIMLDKPIARTLEEADRIIAAVERNHIILMVAFNFRFAPDYMRIREALQGGAIGRVLLAVTRHYQRFCPPAGSNWRNSASVGGGCVLGSGVHNLDMLRYCMGDPEEVFAYGVGDPQRLDAEAAATIVFKYASGAIGTFLCNWVKSSPSGSPDPASAFGEWEFFGENGELRQHLDGRLMTAKLGEEPAPLDIVDQTSPFRRMWEHLVDCIVNGKLPMTNCYEARASQELVLNVYESMRTGKPVRIRKDG